MNKRILVIALGVIGASLMISGCSSSSIATQQKQIELEKQKIELEKAKAELEREKMAQEQRNREYQSDLAQKNATKKYAPDEKRLLIYCLEESYDNPSEYMGGLGIVDGRPDRTHAINDANRAAIMDIASRYIGMIKNAIEDYSKDVNVPSGKKFYESELEGGAAAIGQKLIDKYANVVCRELTKEETGGYVGYVAVRVLTKDAAKGLADELEVRKVDYDKKKFFEKMDAELEKDALKQKKELEAMK
ncbi:MAG: hypothetical protein PHI14_00470 [Bacteroidales bacterium]|nr:hypothetical protein [Bacteroidales bacterium]